MDVLWDAITEALRLLVTGDAQTWEIIGRSLRISLTATALALLLGLPMGALLGFGRFRGRRLTLALVNTGMGVPPVVAGLVVTVMLWRSGPLGALGLLYTPTAMVIAQSILVVPLIAALSRRLVLEGLSEGGDQLRSLGAGPFQSALLALLHERFGVLTVMLTAFGRAVSEVGAVMIVGGNIDGFTRVMTTAIALETSKGDLPLALGLGVVLLGVVGVINLVISAVQGRTSLEREAYA